MPTQNEMLIKQSEGWRLEAEAYRERYEQAMRELSAIRAATAKDVWYWQGDGFDFPESLTCHVVMSADSLRDLLKNRTTNAN